MVTFPFFVTLIPAFFAFLRAVYVTLPFAFFAVILKLFAFVSLALFTVFFLGEMVRVFEDFSGV